MRTVTTLTVAIGLCLTSAYAQKKLTVQDLPAAVQKTVQAELKGGDIKNIGKETEHGVTQYEVETMREGKHRDFEVDTKGTLLVVEDETTIDAIPAAAKATILKKVGAGKLGTVETVSKPGQEMMYEAEYTTKAGKKSEVLVKANGIETKED